MAGFSRLNDAHAPLFHARFLRAVAEQIEACIDKPLEANTWGDALYVVFNAPRDGAQFALRLLDRIQRLDWAAAGLSPQSTLRIALHTGPAFCAFDPVIGRDNYFGSSVTRAARIEPITPPGTIYSSEAFAATLVATDDQGFALDYMGMQTLAKGYGASRIYRLDVR